MGKQIVRVIQGVGQWGGMLKSNSTLETEASRVSCRPKPKRPNQSKLGPKSREERHLDYLTTGLSLLKGQEVVVQLVQDPGWVVAWGMRLASHDRRWTAMSRRWIKSQARARSNPAAE